MPSSQDPASPPERALLFFLGPRKLKWRSVIWSGLLGFGQHPACHDHVHHNQFVILLIRKLIDWHFNLAAGQDPTSGPVVNTAFLPGQTLAGGQGLGNRTENR